ncbi:MAG: hypothetical protein ABIC04_02625 [Nanoarchaeota archaeon]
MFDLSFKVVNGEMFERMDQDCFINNDERENKTWFDEENSILYIQGKSVKINKVKRVTNPHKILKYIFIDNKNNLDDEFFYSEIAENEFGDCDYATKQDSWERYRAGCREIQRKISKQTKGEINNFLIFRTGKQGSVKINKKYL